MQFIKKCWGWWSSTDKWYFADYAALVAAYPVWQNWWNAVLWSTDTVWIWDSWTSAWVDSWITNKNHATLNNLDYANSWHTGFASKWFAIAMWVAL